jgi:hypothetical protein
MQRTRKIVNGRNGRGCMVIRKVPRARVLSYLDSESRRRLGISAHAMLRQYRHGRLKDIGRVADLIVWSDALPQNDPIFGAP